MVPPAGTTCSSCARWRRYSVGGRSSTAASHQPIRPPIPVLRRGAEAELRHLLPEWYWPAAQASETAVAGDLSKEAFLSLFGGRGEGARFVAQEGGVGIVVDKSYALENDLALFSSWNDVRKLARCASIVGIALPCSTWSRARRAPWWSKMPSPLRAPGRFIDGLPGINARNLAKTTTANCLLSQAVRLIRWCLQHNIPGYLQNPWTSMLWTHPLIVKLRATLLSFSPVWTSANMAHSGESRRVCSFGVACPSQRKHAGRGASAREHTSLICS